MPKESIVDATVPSAGRIYDFILGGHHNFEVDRQAAQMILQSFPFVAKMMRLQRWCLQDVARELTYSRGYNAIVDFASGLPTQDHLHFGVPEGTTVIYSDYDPVVVQYAKEILGDTPNLHFYEADARRPEQLLKRPEVEQMLAGKKVALVSWGIGAFITDEELAGLARSLYEWAVPGTCWAFNAQAADFNPEHPAAEPILQMYQRMGTPVYFRSLDRYLELLEPWEPDPNGFISLLDWHGLDQSEMSSEDRNTFGPTGAGYGGYLIK